MLNTWLIQSVFKSVRWAVQEPQAGLGSCHPAVGPGIWCTLPPWASWLLPRPCAHCLGCVPGECPGAKDWEQQRPPRKTAPVLGPWGVGFSLVGGQRRMLLCHQQNGAVLYWGPTPCLECLAMSVCVWSSMFISARVWRYLVVSGHVVHVWL